MDEGLAGRGPQKDSVSADFHWKRSDNSFTFNFLPEASSSLSQNITATTEAQPAQSEGSTPGSGFSFNFQIPTVTAQSDEMAVGAVQTGKTETGLTATSADSSKTKAKKKKKKKEGGGGEVGAGKCGLEKKRTEETPTQQSTELSPEQQLNRELDWCIEQLELGLRTQKLSSKQREETSRALKTLRSSKAPVVKKRQVMRAVSGDYRRKMEDEKNRQFKLIQSAMTSARVTAVSEPSRKPVFRRCAETKKNTTPNMDKPQDTHRLSHATSQTDGEIGKFVLRPSNEEFHFNFDL